MWLLVGWTCGCGCGWDGPVGVAVGGMDLWMWLWVGWTCGCGCGWDGPVGVAVGGMDLWVWLWVGWTCGCGCGWDGPVDVAVGGMDLWVWLGWGCLIERRGSNASEVCTDGGARKKMFFFFLNKYVEHFIIPCGNSGRHTRWVRHSSCKSSAAHCPLCAIFSRVQTIVWLKCMQISMHAIVHGGCTDTVRESALEVDWEKNSLPHRGLEPTSVLRLAFQSDVLPTELLSPRRTE